MTKDPVCGMKVDSTNAAATSEYNNETIYFCNPNCKVKFDAEPDAFISAPPASPRPRSKLL